MENIHATNLLQLVDLDYLAIKATEAGKDVHMLITTDHFEICTGSGNIITDC